MFWLVRETYHASRAFLVSGQAQHGLSFLVGSFGSTGNLSVREHESSLQSFFLSSAGTAGAAGVDAFEPIVVTITKNATF